MAPLRSLSNPISSFNDPFAGTGTRAGEVWFPPPPINRGTRAVFSGGGTYPASPNGTNTMDYITITGATGHANDFGDLVTAPSRSGSASNGTRGICCGGYDNNTSSQSNVIQYYTFATTGNATDSGNLTTTTGSSCAASNGHRAVNANYTQDDTRIDYFSFATGDNATEFGDLYNGDDWMGTVQDLTRALFCGGGNDSPHARSNIIQYVTVATTGDSQDFGDLTVSKRSHSGQACSSTRSVVASGYNQPTNGNYYTVESTEYYTFATLGNAVSFGDMLATSGISPGGTSNSVRGVWMGGGDLALSPSYGTNVIQYVNIPTLGDTIDFGDMVTTGGWCDACSNAHGGL